MTTDELTFSLIINTTDRAGPLDTLLRSLEHQSYPHFEVVVVVGPTRDNTLEILSNYGKRVRVLRCPEANLSQSRNIGLLAARGDIVAFIDDDAVPSRRWLEQLARLFEHSDLDATGGTVYLSHPRRARVQHRLGMTSSLAEQVHVQSSWVEHIIPPGEGRQWVKRMMGTNMAFRRQALLEIGGFDEFFEWVFDEADVAIRATSAGKNLHPVKETVVYHIPASSRNRKAFTYVGKWWLQLKAAVYFIIKNSRGAGDTWPSILNRILRLVHGRWIAYGKLRRTGKLTFRQCWRVRLEEIRAAIYGILSGFFGTRKLIEREAAESALEATKPIKPFQNEVSEYQAMVDPIDGQQAVGRLQTSPLRICLLSSAYPPDKFGGVGRHTNLMAQGLFECGHIVHVITHGDREKTSFYDGAFVHQIPSQKSRYDRYKSLPTLYDCLNYSHAVYEKVRQLQVNEGIQVVDSPLWLIEGLVTAVSEISPVVLRLQTAHRQISKIQDNQSDNFRLMGDMEQALIERADYLVPNSRATLENVGKGYEVDVTEIPYRIIPHGIIPAPDSAIRPFDLEREKETLTVLFVGRLEKRKGIQDLFQSIPSVLQKVPEARFIIVGSDNSAHDGFQRREGVDYPTYFFRQYPQFSTEVEFTGRVSDEELQALYQSCDLFVAPSLYESFGLIYLEAMNYAKPVIGCHAGGVPEVIDDGITGLLVEPANPSALAEAIVSLARSPVKLHEMGVAGRQRLLERFTHIQMARKFIQVYQEAISQKPSGIACS